MMFIYKGETVILNGFTSEFFKGLSELGIADMPSVSLKKDIKNKRFIEN